MAAISDVAKLAGVSKSTASRALSGRGYVSEETRTRVQQVAQSIGFVASTNASSLVTGRSRNVGVVIPYINRWFFAEVLEGIEGALIEAGYDMTLYRLVPQTAERRRVFEYFLVRKRVDAVVAVGIALTASEVGMLHALKKPLVGIGGDIDGIPTLSIDDVSCARLATEHLVSLGHVRIAHFGGSLDHEMDFNVHSQRRGGFDAAMAKAGLSESASTHETDFNVQSGYELAMRVLADPSIRPTAIFASCDEVGIGVIVAARQLGISVPRDLSIIGIDDHELSEMFGLTTLRQTPAAQGALSVAMIMKELESPIDGSVESHQTVEVEFVVRSSTSAPQTVSPPVR